MAHKVIAKAAEGSEASWKVTWEVVADENGFKGKPYRSVDMIFDQGSVHHDFALRDSGLRLFLESAEGVQRELQPADLGSPKAFEFLLETLEATVLAGQKESRAIKLVTPSDKGNIMRADVLRQRMQDLEYIEKTATFAEPLQFFTGEEWTKSTEFVALFKSSAGAIRLRNIPTTQTIDAALHILESELYNRLHTPLVAEGLKRRTIVFLEGNQAPPNRGGTATQFYGAAESMGIDIIALAVEGHWLQGPEFAHWRKVFIPIEIGFDDEFPSRIVAAVKQYGGPVDGILTVFDSLQIALAKAATELGVPYEIPSAYEIGTNKYKLSVFEGRDSFVATTAEEAMKIAQTEDISWPIVVKPCRGWGSEDVFKVDNSEQLAAAAGRMNKARHGTEFVLEHYCDGPEVDINFVMYDGKILFHGMCHLPLLPTNLADEKQKLETRTPKARKMDQTPFTNWTVARQLNSPRSNRLPSTTPSPKLSPTSVFATASTTARPAWTTQPWSGVERSLALQNLSPVRHTTVIPHPRFSLRSTHAHLA